MGNDYLWECVPYVYGGTQSIEPRYMVVNRIENATIAIIPARYASTRFPGKPLVDLAGKPLVQWAVEGARQVVGRVVVATDDQRIYDAVVSFGGEVVMTSPDHPSGTDRCREAYALVGRGEEIVLNLQGDEPFVRPDQIRLLIEAFDSPTTDIATLAEVLPSHTPDAEVANPNIVKVVCSSRGRALYFSRSCIPYLRGIEENYCQHYSYRRHIGMYAFRREVLAHLADLAPSKLELGESLEQLRWLEAGYEIAVRDTPQMTIGIDTPQDLERARGYLASLQ